MPAINSLARRVVLFLLAITPWIAALFLLYWFESRGVWTPDTPYRSVLSVVVLTVGMGLSFSVYSVLQRRTPPGG